MTSNTRHLTRACEATTVPSGDQVTLPEGLRVNITHRLGGNFTVVGDMGMFRILGQDADALGEANPLAAQANGQPDGTASDHKGPPDNDAIWAALKTVFDPEIPVNIVDLGLVYTMEVKEENDLHSVHIDLTLTAPGCGMGPAIAEDARQRVLGVPGVSEAKVEIVWDPPWNQGMITEEGRMELGLV